MSLLCISKYFKHTAMEDKSRYSEDMKTIRRIMEDSTRFLSLSGLSGIFAGLIALIGTTIACFIIWNNGDVLYNDYFSSSSDAGTRILRIQLLIDALLVLFFAVVVSYYFAKKKTEEQGKKIWSQVSRRLLINLIVPLLSGGIFIILLIIQDQFQLIIPSMLIFYGLALVNAGKFTYSEVFYLGLAEILTGILSGFFAGPDILFWGFGFGVLHIVYGFFMFRKYDR